MLHQFKFLSALGKRFLEKLPLRLLEGKAGGLGCRSEFGWQGDAQFIRPGEEDARTNSTGQLADVLSSKGEIAPFGKFCSEKSSFSVNRRCSSSP